MSKSLQDQLLKAGLVTEKAVKQHQRSKKKAVRQLPKGQVVEDEAKRLAREALEERARLDRERNLELQKAAQQRALMAQIRQLLETNRIDRRGGDLAYQFVDDRKVKKILVRAAQHEQLCRGQIGIARLDDDYVLIPAAIAAKIRERDEGAVLVLHQKTALPADEEDPYADYPIPDDLMW